MELPYQTRSAARKSESKQLRRAGQVPAVVYGKGDACEHIAVDAAAFDAVLRQVVKGRLATTRLTLINEKGEKRDAIVKDVQYHPTTYNVLHLDFELLHDNVPVNVNVPVEPVGLMDCVGVKLGGVLRQVIRTLKVRSLPKNIPDHFQLDVREMNMGNAKRLSDLAIPDGVEPRENLDRVAMAIVKR